MCCIFELTKARGSNNLGPKLVIWSRERKIFTYILRQFVVAFSHFFDLCLKILWNRHTSRIATCKLGDTFSHLKTRQDEGNFTSILRRWLSRITARSALSLFTLSSSSWIFTRSVSKSEIKLEAFKRFMHFMTQNKLLSTIVCHIGFARSIPASQSYHFLPFQILLYAGQQNPVCLSAAIQDLSPAEHKIEACNFFQKT